MTNEYSRILKFDFPIIPVLGSLLLLLIWSNDPKLVGFLFNEQDRLILSAVATTIIILGTAGLFVSQLISFALFDQFFAAKYKLRKSNKKGFNHTTEEWFNHLGKELSPKARNSRNSGKSENDRPQLKDLSHGQKQAAVHALEVNCRENHPGLAVQIEHFSAMSIIFSIIGLTSLCFILLYVFDFACKLTFYFGFELCSNGVLLDVYSPALNVMGNSLLFLASFFAAVQARRFQELLRLKLLNSSRLKAIELLGEWYQVELPER